MPSNSFKSFRGTWSDGRTAAALNVTIRFEENGLNIRKTEADIGEIWPYGDLTSVSPLSSGRAAQLGRQDQVGARLFVDDGGFAGKILARAPHLSTHAERKRILAPMLAFTVIVAGVSAAIWYFELSPARAIAGLLPDKARMQLGDLVVKKMTANKKICEAPAGRAALDKLAGRLIISIPEGHRFQLRVVDLGVVNAFATPGERIIVSGKLIRFTTSPEELAGVIAHEIGHGLERHPETGIVRALGIGAGLELLLGGSAGSFGEIGAFLLQLNYSRKAEAEADRHAIGMLQTANISVHPFARFFERLQSRKSSGTGKNANKSITAPPNKFMELLRSHPATAERIAMISATKDVAPRPVLSTSEWAALRDICS